MFLKTIQLSINIVTNTHILSTMQNNKMLTQCGWGGIFSVAILWPMGKYKSIKYSIANALNINLLKMLLLPDADMKWISEG